jgi:hypothetical protein
VRVHRGRPVATGRALDSASGGAMELSSGSAEISGTSRHSRVN